mmetsp:Transcript_17584/g.38071  ORF Transcript_17584/g.38071 Transcript_17584/m.38071 type:complete len:229 (+) Transcript_17584:447-1133(+)
MVLDLMVASGIHVGCIDRMHSLKRKVYWHWGGNHRCCPLLHVLLWPGCRSFAAGVIGGRPADLGGVGHDSCFSVLIVNHPIAVIAPRKYGGAGAFVGLDRHGHVVRTRWKSGRADVFVGLDGWSSKPPMTILLLTIISTGLPHERVLVEIWFSLWVASGLVSGPLHPPPHHSASAQAHPSPQKGLVVVRSRVGTLSREPLEAIEVELPLERRELLHLGEIAGHDLGSE